MVIMKTILVTLDEIPLILRFSGRMIVPAMFATMRDHRIWSNSYSNLYIDWLKNVIM